MTYDKNHALLETRIPGLPAPKRGKVRDVFDLGDTLLMVVTDRISSSRAACRTRVKCSTSFPSSGSTSSA